MRSERRTMASSVGDALVRAQAAMKTSPLFATHDTRLDEAFPVVNPNYRPFGERVLVQIRSPKRKSAGGIMLPDEVRDTEKWNTQVAKVIALGPTAFKSRTTLEGWPEGDWCQPGDF